MEAAVVARDKLFRNVILVSFISSSCFTIICIILFQVFYRCPSGSEATDKALGDSVVLQTVETDVNKVLPDLFE